MPDPNFTVVDVRSAFEGITPLMQFGLDVENRASDRIESIILQTQIRIEPARRAYEDAEKERLVELFGSPERWGQSVRSMVWTHVGLNVPAFDEHTRVQLPVPVTYDLNVAAAKYFYGLEDGEIPLLFLFSGTVFYTEGSGRLLMQRIAWEKEARYGMPVRSWKELMDQHHPDKSWLYLERDVFEALYAFKRRAGLPTWDAAVTRLLEAQQEERSL